MARMIEEFWYGALEESSRYWWIHLVRGLAALVFAAAVIAWPAVTIVILAVLLAVWAAVLGVSELVQAFRLRSLGQQLRSRRPTPWP
jgi:uncharacterized membrane protein HdeD (DUF308 family)